MTLVFREPRAGDCEALLANMRQADRDEVDALLGPGAIEQQLQPGVDGSVLKWTVEFDGELVCILGLNAPSLMGDHGMPWLLGTPLVETHRRGLVRAAPSYIARMLALYPILCNCVDARNVKAISWLKRTGFKILPAQPIGVMGLPFHPFSMGA